jgi:hypothetical protein
MESRIPQTAAGWFWLCGPTLNLPNDIFSIKICPLDPGDHMLSQKFLVEVNTGKFSGENWPLRPKYTIPTTYSACIASFLPFATASGLQSFSSFFILKTMFLLLLRPQSRALSIHWWKAISMVTEGSPTPKPHLHNHMDCHPSIFAFLSPYSPPRVAAADPQKQSMTGRPRLYLIASIQLLGM